jgi:Uma2 family endonuclease
VFPELRHLHRPEEWVFLPDIALTLRDRLAGVSFAGDSRPEEALPDFAVEVLSPGDRPGRVQLKVDHYMRAGIRLLWVVYPEEELVAVWEPGKPPRMAGSEGVLDASPVLPGFRVDLAELFGRVREG